MEDQADIDSLLDQIEKNIKFTQPASMIRPTTTKTMAEDLEELSQLIDDIRSATDLSVDGAELKSTGSQRGRPVIEDQCKVSSSEDLQQQRCFPTYLGGSSVDVGLYSTTTYSRCCANLRCIDCDFSVIRQEDYAWHSSTDYLFLRNHMPDVAKLRARLIPKTGCCAYACQCSWRNVEQLADVKSDPTLRWICGKH